MHDNDWNEYKNLFIDFKKNTEGKLLEHDKKLDRINEDNEKILLQFDKIVEKTQKTPSE